ncbi:hypothetical protein H2200_002231 [Cladophialophora chaetospira]|uniref:Uncharacterized protein n=1 Tax=Cladophialophora chaetospira TaxID=386627 RepID=A0AA38XIG8_9EURO|nr:hypothetical protein H2200_002231 [Cladophialophora chaetospira]
MEADLLYMSASELAQSIKTAQLELAYERALREAERIYEEERARALRVQILLLEHENDDFQEQAAKDEDEQHHMEDANEELRAHLAEVETELQQTQMDLKARIRDLDHLRTEVNALNAASSDATKLLTEKLALARELNTIKPELEHLKSQSFTSQKLLSEKLSLQREVSSLQVELDNEKRAVQRIKAREESSSREDSALTAEIETLRKELTKTQRDAAKISSAREEATAEIDTLRKELVKAQRDAHKQASQDNSASTAEIETLKKDLSKAQRDAQKTERESRKKVTEWESEKEVLEGKLDAFRNKLRSTKEQLHEAQEEIEKLQAVKMAQSAEHTKARINGTAATANPRKRNVARFDPDMTIGTPGNGGPAAKKPRVSVNVGDKSSFSITPFLNRTLTILPESPDDEEEPQKDAKPRGDQQIDGANDERVQAPKSKATKAKQDKPAAAQKLTVPAKSRSQKPLKETTGAKGNATMKKPQLPKLLEEDSDIESDEDGQVNANGHEDKENTNNTETTGKDATEPTKTQRPPRTNIFDEENSAPAPKIRTLGGGGGLGRINLKAKPIGKGKPLAEFSPLKKDRRAASILE